MGGNGRSEEKISWLIGLLGMEVSLHGGVSRLRLMLQAKSRLHQLATIIRCLSVEYSSWIYLGEEATTYDITQRSPHMKHTPSHG